MTGPRPILPRAKSLEGISFRELESYERTVDDGEELPPPGGIGEDSGPFHFVTEVGGLYVIGTHPAASTWLDDTGYFLVPSTKAGDIVAWAHVVVGGASGSYLDVCYSVNGGASFVSTGIEIPLYTLGPKMVAVELPEGARLANTIYRGEAVGGDDAASPEIYNFAFALRAERPGTVPDPDDPEIPTGSPWGNIVFDIDAGGTQMQAMYTDGEDVNPWPDETAYNNDMGTVGVFLLPKYKATAFTGGLPCVEWVGGDIPLTTASNPTQPYGDYTYYFVLEDLDGGGDGSLLWGGGFTDSFQYSLRATGNQISAANNNLFGTPSITVTDDWGMSGAHIYRWVKDSASASHHLFVDGVLKGSAGAAPQTNNNGQTQLMNYLTGLGLSVKVGRVVAYDESHLSPTNTGDIPVNGLTGPEIALRAFWGTP